MATLAPLATPNDVRALSIPATAIGTKVTDEILQQMILAESAVAYGILSSRYAPEDVAAAADPALNAAICDMVAFRALKLRGFNPKNESDKTVMDARDEAMTFLADVAGGRRHLNVTAAFPDELGSSDAPPCGRGFDRWPSPGTSQGFND